MNFKNDTFNNAGAVYLASKWVNWASFVVILIFALGRMDQDTWGGFAVISVLIAVQCINLLLMRFATPDQLSTFRSVAVFFILLICFLTFSIVSD